MVKEVKLIYHPTIRQWIELMPAELRRIKRLEKKIWKTKVKSPGIALID